MRYIPPIRNESDYMVFRMDDSKDMTDQRLLDLISAFEQRVARRYNRLWRAYCGMYDIMDTSIVPVKAAYKPDNRLAVNFARYGTDMFVGFNFGIPAKCQYQNAALADGDRAKFDATTADIDSIVEFNEMDDLDAQTGTDSFIFGIGQRILYFEDDQINIAGVSPMDGFAVYNNSIKPRMRYFVRLYTDEDNVQRGSISDDTTVRYFRRNGGIVWEDEHPHGFPGVPAVVYKFDSSVAPGVEPTGGFEGVLPLINAFGAIFSAKWNDVDAFADAYLLIVGPDVAEDTARAIRESHIINLKGKNARDALVQFLQRPTGDETQEHMLDRLYDLIFTTMYVCNTSDDRFATTSGVALKYKMLNMDNLAAKQWRAFSKGNNRMWQLICGNPVTAFDPDDWRHIKYKHTLNYPANVADEASTAKTLDGVVSKRTQLSTLSVVRNVDEEIAQIEREAVAAAELQSQLQGIVGATDGSGSDSDGASDS